MKPGSYFRFRVTRRYPYHRKWIVTWHQLSGVGGPLVQLDTFERLALAQILRFCYVDVLFFEA